MVVEPDEVLKRAFELADTITDMAPLAVENMKKVHQHRYEHQTGGKPWNRDRYLRFLLRDEDHLEATTAFLEKRAHGGVYEKIEKTLPNRE